jgi:hypothetical protein
LDVDDTRYPDKCGIDLEEPDISTFITPLIIYVFTPTLGQQSDLMPQPKAGPNTDLCQVLLLSLKNLSSP